MHVHLRLNISSGVHLIMKMLSDRSEKIKKLEGSSNFIHLHRFLLFTGVSLLETLWHASLMATKAVVLTEENAVSSSLFTHTV